MMEEAGQVAAGPREGRMRGRVSVRGLEVFAYHGCLPEEKERGQLFLVDLEVDYDVGPAVANDDLSLALDYDSLVREAHSVVSGERYDLLETLAVRLARLLSERHRPQRVWVRVRKPQAPLAHTVEWVGVEVEVNGSGSPDREGGEG